MSKWNYLLQAFANFWFRRQNNGTIYLEEMYYAFLLTRFATA